MQKHSIFLNNSPITPKLKKLIAAKVLKVETISKILCQGTLQMKSNCHKNYEQAVNSLNIF